jgi:hypothetical protein
VQQESALAHILLVFGISEGANMRLALLDGGVEKVSDLRELRFAGFGLLEYTQRPSVTATTAAVTKHLNILQRRKLMLIHLWFQDHDIHELTTLFDLTSDLYDTWRAVARAEKLGQRN